MLSKVGCRNGRHLHRCFPARRASCPKPCLSAGAHKLTLQTLWRRAICEEWRLWANMKRNVCGLSVRFALVFSVRIATSPMRRLPDVYIVGAAKCGTSALYSYLCLHPGHHDKLGLQLNTLACHKTSLLSQEFLRLRPKSLDFCTAFMGCNYHGFHLGLIVLAFQSPRV